MLSSAFAITISYLVGLGALYLPFLLQKAGLLYFFLGLAGAFIAMLIYADVKTNKHEIARLLEILLHYFAISAYILAAGEQLSFLTKKSYGALLFFIIFTLVYLLSSFDIEDYSTAGGLLLFFALVFVSAYLAPLQKGIPFEKNPRFLLKTFAVGSFALYAHSLLKFFKEDSKKAFKYALFVAFLAYLLYSYFVASAIQNLEPLTTASISKVCKGVIPFIISLAAIIAFATSYVGIIQDLDTFFKRYTKKPFIFSVIMPAVFALAALYLNASSFQVVYYFAVPALSLMIALHAWKEYTERKSIPFLILSIIYALTSALVYLA